MDQVEIYEQRFQDSFNDQKKEHSVFKSQIKKRIYKNALLLCLSQLIGPMRSLS